MITQLLLKQTFEYNPTTGIFTWKSNVNKDSSWNTRFVGKPAGGVSNGYIRLEIGNESIYAHIAAFIYMTNERPDKVDHKDTIKTNNSWSNLRICTQSQNSANRQKPINNTSGYKNVSWFKPKNKWRVKVTKDGKSYHGGYFNSLEEAVLVANSLRKELFGEFSLYETFKDI